jgi:hypothetical protein
VRCLRLQIGEVPICSLFDADTTIPTRSTIYRWKWIAGQLANKDHLLYCAPN